MARFIQLQNSFASGELSEKMMARTDLDIAKNGAKLIENMEILPEGGVTKRNGFSSQSLVDSRTNFTPSLIDWDFIEFKTSDNKLLLVKVWSPLRSDVGVYPHIYLSISVNGIMSEAEELSVTSGNPPMGRLTDWLQIGDILVLTFDSSEPYVITYSNGTIQYISIYNFLNKEIGYLSCPVVDRSYIDPRVSIACSSTSLSNNTLSATYRPFYLYGSELPYPLFKISSKGAEWGIRGNICLHHSTATGDNLFVTSFHSIFYEQFQIPKLVGTVQANLVDIIATSSTGLTSGCKISYTESGVNKVGYLLNTAGTTWRIVPNYEDIFFAPLNPIQFAASGAITLNAIELTTVNVITEVAALNTAKANSYSESVFNTKFGFPTTVGMIDGRLAFSGVEGFSNKLFVSSAYNLFRLNGTKLRQDDQTFYKVNTKAADVSGLNFFGASSQADAWDLVISSNSVTGIRWIKQVGSFTTIGTDREELIATIDYSGSGLSAKTTVVSSFGSSNSNALSCAGNTYFISKYNELIQLVPNVDGGVKAGNISALNSTIIDFTVDSLLFNERKQCLYILPKGVNKVIGYSVSKLTGVSGFFRLTFDNPSSGTFYLQGGCFFNNNILLGLHEILNSKYWNLHLLTPNSTYTDYASTPFTARVELLPYDFGNPYGTALTTMRRLHSIGVKLYKTSACSIGSSITNMEDLILDSLEFTGEKLVNFPASPDTSPRVIFESSADLPLTILGVVFKGEAFE